MGNKMKTIEVVIRHVTVAEAFIQKQRRNEAVRYQGEVYKVVGEGECVGNGATAGIKFKLERMI